MKRQFYNSTDHLFYNTGYTKIYEIRSEVSNEYYK